MADDGTHLHEPDDHLIERLHALGPVLDQLYDDAADPAPPNTGLRHPPRRRRRGDKRRTLVGAAVFVLLAAAVVASVLARDDTSSVTSDQTTTTTTVADTELASLVSTRIDDVKRCGGALPPDQWPGEWPAGWAQVGSHTCSVGWVEAGVETVRPLPVYDTPAVADGAPPVAWWSPSTGWIVAEEYDDPDFDLARYRAAYSAALEARGEDPDQLPTDGTYYAKP